MTKKESTAEKRARIVFDFGAGLSPMPGFALGIDPPINCNFGTIHFVAEAKRKNRWANLKQ